jgi:hypothetical protein
MLGCKPSVINFCKFIVFPHIQSRLPEALSTRAENLLSVYLKQKCGKYPNKSWVDSDKNAAWLVSRMII